MADFTEMIASDCGLKKKPITARNPQAYSIIERKYQTLGNMIRSFEVHDTSRVLINQDRSSKFEDYAYKGPYEILKVNNNSA
eukprot:2984975-Ditylum_brightwellii.AAC.1